METNNEYTSVQSQAKKGLSTFILTLSISLIVFSTIYYLMTNESSDDTPSFETSSQISVVSENEEPEVQGDFTSTKTVFGEIADSDPGSYPKQVLAGADVAVEENTVEETTQSGANLDTGITSVTIGLVSAITLFLSAMIFVYNNPRKIALTSFEKKTTKGL